MRNKETIKEMVEIENIVENGLNKLYNKNSEGIFYNEKFEEGTKELENTKIRSRKEIKTI